MLWTRSDKLSNLFVFPFSPCSLETIARTTFSPPPKRVTLISVVYSLPCGYRSRTAVFYALQHISPPPRAHHWAHAVKPQNGVKSTEGILTVQTKIQNAVLSNQPLHRVVFTFHPSYASSLLLNAGSWDEPKRTIVRQVFQEARQNFHRHPRPWYAA